MKSPTLEAQQKKAREEFKKISHKDVYTTQEQYDFLDSQIAQAYEAGKEEEKIKNKEELNELYNIAKDIKVEKGRTLSLLKRNK